jgi:hypothetical protein
MGTGIPDDSGFSAGIKRNLLPIQTAKCRQYQQHLSLLAATIAVITA